MTNRSLFWARLLGLYAVIISLWTFINIENLQILFSAIGNNPALIMTLGVFTLFMGLAIIISHNVWRGWPLVITLVGYWITLKGIALLFFPQWINQISAAFLDKNMFVAPIPSLVIGLILLFCGVYYRNK